MSGLDVEREASEEQGQTGGGGGCYIISKRRESGSHKTQRDTNHQRQSLLLYTTPLYLLSILYQFMLFIQIN